MSWGIGNLSSRNLIALDRTSVSHLPSLSNMALSLGILQPKTLAAFTTILSASLPPIFAASSTEKETFREIH